MAAVANHTIQGTMPYGSGCTVSCEFVNTFSESATPTFFDAVMPSLVVIWIFAGIIIAVSAVAYFRYRKEHESGSPNQEERNE
jgi:beta-lactamase regulating signal transducer with metallopeptidase domain